MDVRGGGPRYGGGYGAGGGMGTPLQPRGGGHASLPRPLYNTTPTPNTKRTYVKRGTGALRGGVPDERERDRVHDRYDTRSDRYDTRSDRYDASAFSGVSSGDRSDRSGHRGQYPAAQPPPAPRGGGVHLVNADELVTAVHDLCEDRITLRDRLNIVEQQCSTLRRVLESQDIARDYGGIDGFFERVPSDLARLTAAVETLQQTQVADRIQLELEMKELRAKVVQLQYAPGGGGTNDTTAFASGGGGLGFGWGEKGAGGSDSTGLSAASPTSPGVGLSWADVAPAQELSQALRAQLSQREAGRRGGADGQQQQQQQQQKLFAFCSLIQKDLLEVSAEQVRLRGTLADTDAAVRALQSHIKLRDTTGAATAGVATGGTAVSLFGTASSAGARGPQATPPPTNVSLALRFDELQRRVCEVEATVEEVRETCEELQQQQQQAPPALPTHHHRHHEPPPRAAAGVGAAARGRVAPGDGGGGSGAILDRPVVPGTMVSLSPLPSPLAENSGGAYPPLPRRESVTLADQLDRMGSGVGGVGVGAPSVPRADSVHIHRERGLAQWEADLRRREEVLLADMAARHAAVPPPQIVQQPQPTQQVHRVPTPAPVAETASAPVPEAVPEPQPQPSPPATPLEVVPPSPPQQPQPHVPASTTAAPTTLATETTDAPAAHPPPVEPPTAAADATARRATLTSMTSSSSATLDVAFKTQPQAGQEVVRTASETSGHPPPDTRERSQQSVPASVPASASTHHIKLSGSSDDETSDDDLLPDVSPTRVARGGGFGSPTGSTPRGRAGGFGLLDAAASSAHREPDPPKPRSALLDDDMAALLGLGGDDSDVDSDPLTSME